ncbi:unnamed protein product [Bursaphelenchus xylophilus]|uniref:non-specific serine/threonine protein kinase n=1 Tax=Bursaphelenchus xylophilus TaxID=6326 RepID=A0A1I7S898_BURXY|nr:unnamed protein product [Bursaphelenchus xylophilus]CAG9080385.1 unnamed protein product [Bursaphelenchus xylophilus]
MYSSTSQAEELDPVNPMAGFRKLCTIGQGAFGVCSIYHKPRDARGPPKKYIVKRVMIPMSHGDTRRNVINEAKLLRSLNHPNIVECYGYKVCGNELNIIMHYAEGGTLDKLIRDQQGVYIPEKTIMYYFAQVARAIRYIHSKRILHRDLKTQNILLNRRRTRVMLADFGISRELNTSAAHSFVGTPSYVSPELCNGNPYNNKSDMWALGCILYEMVELTGPFSGEIPIIYKRIANDAYRPIENPNTTIPVKDLLNRLLDKNPVERPSAEKVITFPWVLEHCVLESTELCRAVTATALDIKPADCTLTPIPTDDLQNLETLQETEKNPSFYLNKDFADETLKYVSISTKSYY